MNEQDYLKDKWETEYERSGCISTASYHDSIEYFRMFDRSTPYARLTTLGITSQGREMKALVVAKDNAFSPKRARRANKAVVLIQNGIHPGEIEGKDAWMLLLRDMLVTQTELSLLDHLTLLIIPVVNPDGHERTSEFNRPNQNGPKEMGWRTTALNLNMNRDYMKADTPEMRALLRFFSNWQPDLIIDNHTTNGADYQYHITYGIEKKRTLYPSQARFANEEMLPFVLSRLEAEGFLTAPYIEFFGKDLLEGIIDYPALPRYSTGYAAAQNRIALLVETHSLKPYKNRVESTLHCNKAVLQFINAQVQNLKKLNKKADKDAITKYAVNRMKFPVAFKPTETYYEMNFQGFERSEFTSPITGAEVVQYSTIPVTFPMRVYNGVKPSAQCTAPLGGWVIPSAFAHVVRILRLHGIEVIDLKESFSVEASQYRFINSSFAVKPYEGRFKPQYELETVKLRLTTEPGDFYVPVKQRTIKVILHLLEPASPDSFAAWGFFNAFFERKEYAESYVFEPIAQKMYEDNEVLREEFNRLLETDEAFAESPSERLDFFYRNSPYFDKGEKKHPVFRLFTPLPVSSAVSDVRDEV